MLLRFRFSNFRSFRDEQELSMIAGPFREETGATIEVPGLTERVLPVAAIYGANASGKTNVLRAVSFMRAAVRDSHNRWVPDGGVPTEPFGCTGTEGVPSRFEVDFLQDGTRYQYGFEVSSRSVEREWLYAYPRGKKQVWFQRKAGVKIRFGPNLPGENRAVEALTRPNSLLLSTAVQNNHESLLPIYSWFRRIRLIRSGLRLEAASSATELESLATETARRNFLRLVSAADLGIVDFRIEARQAPSESVTVLKAVEMALREHTRQPDGLKVKFPSTTKQVRFKHVIGSDVSELEPEDESDGTVAYVKLIAAILMALEDGSLVMIDEFDSSLHSLLAREVIRLFNEAVASGRRGQMLFNTHDSNLLGSGTLRRDEIWFTEKDRHGVSHLYPLSDFKPRVTENLENGYLQGRYGAIPFLGPADLIERLGETDCQRR